MSGKVQQSINDFKEQARVYNEKHPLVFDRTNEWKWLALLLCVDNMHLANSRDLREFSRKQRRTA